MLNWWLGKPVGGKYSPDADPELEQPETPAPIFAARALKSAIFGTPAPLDDTMCDHEGHEDGGVITKEVSKPQQRSLSPTKPPGILLTPGTANMRRKTVSFGNDVVNKEAGKNDADLMDGNADSQSSRGNEASASLLETSAKPARRTNLTKTLENARARRIPKSSTDSVRSALEEPPVLSTSSKNVKEHVEPDTKSEEPKVPQLRARTSGQQQRGNFESTRDKVETANTNSDATIDLNEPLSKSGRYWKSEYEQYHESCKEQMEKLIKYKSLVKSYANLKDEQATSLTQKLAEEKEKVVEMESKVSQLSARIASSGPDGIDSTPEMMRELARQTALSLQYKAEVEGFRKAMEEAGRAPSEIKSARRRTPALINATDNVNDRLKKMVEPLAGIEALRSEVKSLRQSLQIAEEANSKLQDDNTRLTQELHRAELRHTSHLEKCDKKRDSLDGQLLRKDERFHSLQNDFDKFKDLAKRSRLDAELHLKKRHDQIVALRNQVASLRGEKITALKPTTDSQKHGSTNEKITTESEKRNEALQENHVEGLVQLHDHGIDTDDNDELLPLKSANLIDPPAILSPYKRESQIPILNSISRPSKASTSSKPTASETPMSIRHRSSKGALSEIVNGASVDTIPPEGSGPVQRTPLLPQVIPRADLYSNRSPESPELPPRSPEPSVSTNISNRAIHDRNCYASPRPSMYNIASSPRKTTSVRPRAKEVTKQTLNNDLEAARSSGLITAQTTGIDASRVRREMAPDKLAAAKARLEQKKLLRKSETQKENMQE